MRSPTSLAVWLIAFAALTAQATDVFYMDSEDVSENGRYRVHAKSPDNKDGNWKKPFARNFTYTLTDLGSTKTVWTRQQGEREGSCSRLYVDNDGWVVIKTGWDALIFVDPMGQDTGKVDILKDAFNKEEREKYVHHTTAGPMWAGYSTWYFVRQDHRRLFVIRPWWDRRVITDVEKGTLVPENTSISAACFAYEKALVLRELRKAVETRDDWEQRDSYEEVWPILKAAYLAGKMRITEAVPLLREIQDSTYSGVSSTSWSSYKPPEGGVDPSNWEEMTMRRVVHLSLRRLGASPAQHDCTTFDVHFEDYRLEHSFSVGPLSHHRADRAGDVGKGMKPEQVLAIIGAPDFNSSDSWHYDMDTDDPYTLTVTWGENGVADIDKKRPPLWKSESWDQEVVN